MLSLSQWTMLTEEVGELTPTCGVWRGTLFTWLPEECVSIALLQEEVLLPGLA